MYFATLPNCWNPLRAFDTKKYKKLYFGQEKNLGYGDNSKDWAISSQFLNLVKDMETVQRLDGSGRKNSNLSFKEEGLKGNLGSLLLRYSLIYI